MTPRRVLVVQFRRIGDVLLTTPLLGAVRAAWPDARIGVLVDRGCDEVLQAHPWVDEVLAVPREAWRGVRSATQAVRTLRAFHPDVTIDAMSTPASAALCALAGASTRVGFDLRTRRVFYTHVVPRPVDATYVAFARQALLEPLGIAPLHVRPRVAPAFARLDWATNALGALGSPDEASLVCLSPTSRRAHRRWPLNRFAEVARVLADDGAHVCVLWGPGEREDAERVAQLAQRPLRVRPSPDTTDLRAVAGILARSALLVGNDNGIRHLAIALDVPTIGIFSANDPRAWTPPPGTCVVAHRTHAGGPCTDGEPACTHPRCVRAVRAADVIADARALRAPSAQGAARA